MHFFHIKSKKKRIEIQPDPAADLCPLGSLPPPPLDSLQAEVIHNVQEALSICK